MTTCVKCGSANIKKYYKPPRDLGVSWYSHECAGFPRVECLVYTCQDCHYQTHGPVWSITTLDDKPTPKFAVVLRAEGPGSRQSDLVRHTTVAAAVAEARRLCAKENLAPFYVLVPVKIVQGLPQPTEAHDL